MKKLGFLDGVRGIAALIVVFHHYVLAFFPAMFFGNIERNHFVNEHQYSTSPLQLFFNGSFAVCIFFVLSGFVLSLKYLQTKDNDVLREYTLKRYFRLIIPIFASSLLYFFISGSPLLYNKLIGPVTHSEWWLSGICNGKFYLKEFLQITFGKVFSDSDNSYNAVLWTMKYELFGSFLIFSILFLMTKVDRKKILFVLFISYFLITKNFYYIGFLLGIILAWIWVNEKQSKLALRSRVIRYSILLLGLFCASVPAPNANTAHVLIYKIIISPFPNAFLLFHLAGGFLIIYFLIHSERSRNILSGKFFKFLGNISFSLYLVHLFVLITLSSYLMHTFTTQHSYIVSFWRMAGISIVVLIPFSWLFYYLVDRNSIKWSSNISNFLFFKRKK